MWCHLLVSLSATLGSRDWIFFMDEALSTCRFPYKKKLNPSLYLLSSYLLKKG